jgi:hypothetical protein
MHRYTIFFITVNDIYVSGGFSAHHQELKTAHTAYGICQVCLLLPLAWVSWKNLFFFYTNVKKKENLTFMGPCIVNVFF